MGAKSGEKTICRKVISRLCRYPVGQKFCQNRSILLSFQGKNGFAFYAEIPDGHQKWQENAFVEKSPVVSADTLRVKNIMQRSPVESSDTVF